jgi:Saccharopine dehydrogenase and related proteins
MGRVVARDLLESEADATVTLLDLNPDLLREAAGFVADPRLVARPLDVTDREAAAAALRGHCAAVAALPHGRSLDALRAAISAGVPIVDLVGSYPERRMELDRAAREAGVLVVPGCGVAPGLSNVFVARGVEMLDVAEEAIIYVGGIPVERTPPLEYQTVYSLQSMFGAFMRPARIWRDGQATTVEPLSGVELLDFGDEVGTLEAFYTDGLASLPLTMAGKITRSLEEKTLRYPGFAERVAVLKSCGMLDAAPVHVGGVEVAPRDVLIHQVAPALELGPEGDIVVMRVRVTGASGGEERSHVFDLLDRFDSASGVTAMARTTGYTASVTARMICAGKLPRAGVFFPEQLFAGTPGEELLEELARRGVVAGHSIWPRPSRPRPSR